MRSFLYWLPIMAVIAFFYPVLFGGKLITGVAHGISEDFPIHFWFGEALKQGSWGINPLYFAGVPSYLSQMDFLHPVPFLFYKFFDSIRVYYWLIALSFIGQWYTFYLLSRKLRISSLSASFASFVWIFNQWNVQWGGLEAIAIFLVSVPLLFFLVIKISESSQKLSYVFLAAVVLAPNWVFSLTQTTLYLSSALILFAAFLDFRKNGYRLLEYKNVLLLMTVILLSVAIVFPIIQADYSIYRLSWRSGGLSYHETFNDDYNLFDLIHFVSPLVFLQYLNTQHTHFYAGILPLLFFFLAWKVGDKNHYTKFFGWMAVATLILAARFSPLFYLLVQLPVFDLFRGSGKFLFLTGMSLAVMSGFGLDALKEAAGIRYFTKIAGFYKKFLIVVCLIIASINTLYHLALESIQGISFRIFMHFGYARTLKREPGYYFEKIREVLGSWFYQFSFSNFELWLTIATLASTGFVIWLLLKKKISVISFSVLAIIIVFISPLLIWHSYYGFVSASILEPTPVVQFLIDNRDSRYRALSFNLGIETYKKLGLEYKDPEKFFKFETSTLVSDVFMFYGLEMLNGHEAFLTKRQEFFSEFIGQFATQTKTVEEKRKIFENQAGVLSMMNVKYVLSSVPLGRPFLKMLDSNIPDTRIPLYVYENPKVLPKIYFAQETVYLKENLPDTDLRRRIYEVKDFERQTLVECDNCPKVPAGDGGVTNIVSEKAGDITVEVRNKSDSWLMFSWSFLPGWHAFVDGEEVNIYRANYVFQAIQIPAGTHTISFKYEIL